jgi:hypothetical protein
MRTTTDEVGIIYGRWDGHGACCTSVAVAEGKGESLEGIGAVKSSDLLVTASSTGTVSAPLT